MGQWEKWCDVCSCYFSLLLTTLDTCNTVCWMAADRRQCWIWMYSAEKELEFLDSSLPVFRCVHTYVCPQQVLCWSVCELKYFCGRIRPPKTPELLWMALNFIKALGSPNPSFAHTQSLCPSIECVWLCECVMLFLAYSFVSYVSFSPFLCPSLSLCPELVIVSFVCLSSVFWIREGGQLWTTPALKTLRAGSRVCVCWTTLSLNGHSWGWNTVAVTHATGAFVSQTPVKRPCRGALIWSSC